MHINIRSQLKGYFLCLIFSGCASFEPGLGYQDLSRPRAPTVKEVQEGLEVSAEEFASANKSRQAFDADIALHSVLALLLKAENNGDKTYKVTASEITAYLHDQPLTALSSKQASQAAASEYAGKAILWAIAPGPLIFFLEYPELLLPALRPPIHDQLTGG